MEDYSRNSEIMQQLSELVNDCELYLKKESRDTQVKSSPSQFGFRTDHFVPFGCSSSGNYSDHSNTANQYPVNHDYVQSCPTPVYPDSSYDSQFQQNFYPQDHYHVSDFDQAYSYYPQYQNSDSVSFSQNSACYDASYDFQYQEPISEPNSFAYTQYQQETQTLEHDQWNYYDSEPSPMQEATTATFQYSDLEAMLQSSYDSTDAKFQCLEESIKRMEEQIEQLKQNVECQVEADFRNEVKESDISNDSSCVLLSCVGTLAEDDEGEEKNQPTMVENEQELVQEEEKQREPEFYANQFFISDDGKEANINVFHENSCILDDADSFFDEESSIEELDYFEELEKNQISSLQEKQTEEEEMETEKLSINLFSMFEKPDSCEENFRESKEQKQEDIEPNDGNGSELEISTTDCVSLTSFVGSLADKKEELTLSKVAEKTIDDSTCDDSDFLLHEEGEEMAISLKMEVEQPLTTEKKEEEAPVQDIDKASEPFEPQITSLMLKEEETEEFIISEPLPSDFALTNNLCFLVVNVMISGGKAQKKQWNLKICYKLHLPCLYGEVCKRGANGDGILWNIKVHPP